MAAVRPSVTPWRSSTGRAYAGAGAPARWARAPGRRRPPSRDATVPVLHFAPAIPPQRVGSAPRGDVAQLGEHRVRIAGVRGSSPLISTTLPGALRDMPAHGVPSRRRAVKSRVSPG